MRKYQPMKNLQTTGGSFTEENTYMVPEHAKSCFISCLSGKYKLKPQRDTISQPPDWVNDKAQHHGVLAEVRSMATLYS